MQVATAGEERQRFHDVAGIIYYLRVVPWAVPEYTLTGAPDGCASSTRPRTRGRSPSASAGS